MLEQRQLLVGLLPGRVEIFLMRVAYVRDDAQIGADHPFEPRHFAPLRDTRLDQHDPVVRLGHQQRQRDADLRVVAFRTAEQPDLRRVELGDPFLHDGLAVASRDGDDRSFQAGPVIGGQLLQRFERVGAADESRQRVGFRIDRRVGQKGAYAPTVQFRYVLVSVAAGAP